MKKEKHLEINENNYKGYVELYKTKLITPDREKKEKLKSTLIGLGFMFVIPFISISFLNQLILIVVLNLDCLYYFLCLLRILDIYFYQSKVAKKKQNCK